MYCLTYGRLGLLWSEPSRAIPSGTVLIIASILQPIKPPIYTGIPPVSGCRSISSVGSGPVLLAGCSTPSVRPQRALSRVTAAENTSFREPALQKCPMETAGTGGSPSRHSCERVGHRVPHGGGAAGQITYWHSIRAGIDGECGYTATLCVFSSLPHMDK